MPKYRLLSKSEVADIFEQYVFKFITNDIGREVQLAWRTVNGKRDDDLLPGGGNVLAAMGLLAATEFLGWIWMHADAANRKWDEEGRFNQVLRRMGDCYETVLDTKATTGINVYAAFRSGLLHFYGVGGPNISADMPGTNAACGILHEADGWHLVVEVYFRDLSRVADDLYRELTGIDPRR